MIKVSNFYGFIFKKESLNNLLISSGKLAEIMETKPIDEDNDIVSFGPSFGKEAADVFIKRLESIGLFYVSDFYIFECDLPDWLSFYVSIKKTL